MFNNNSNCIILGLIIIILIGILINKIYQDKKSIKENFYASIYDNIDDIKDDISDLSFQQDVNKGTTNKNNQKINNTRNNIKKLDMVVNKNLNSVNQNIDKLSDQQENHENRLKVTEKTNLIMDNILSEDGDIPTQGRMLNNIIDNSNIEREKWSREFYDLKQKQDSNQIKNQNILNELLNERKEFKNLVKDSQEKISQQTNKFTQGINRLGEFHDNYQKELESILKRKYNLSQDSFDLNEKVQESRINKLKKELGEINTLKKKITGIEDNESRSIKCLGNGDKLNIRPVEFNGNPTGKYIIFMNNGCLNYKNSGVYGTTPCEMSDLQQHFVINDVNDYKEYNKLIDIVNDGTKEFVFENDDVKYPFKIVTPLEREGECLTINDDGLSIEPIINDANQRFRTSLIPQTANCKSKFE
jgi:hypothetical protein